MSAARAVASPAQTQPAPGRAEMMAGDRLAARSIPPSGPSGCVDGTGNADLAVDEVMQFQWNYDAIVKEKSTGNCALALGRRDQ